MKYQEVVWNKAGLVVGLQEHENCVGTFRHRTLRSQSGVLSPRKQSGEDKDIEATDSFDGRFCGRMSCPA